MPDTKTPKRTSTTTTAALAKRVKLLEAQLKKQEKINSLILQALIFSKSRDSQRDEVISKIMVTVESD